MNIHIISASRRTDIPAFYGQWFMRRVHAGWCAVPNPFNSKQVSQVALSPERTLLVFWTRWAAPFLKAVAELKGRGYRFYFQYTLVNYPAAIDPHSPPLDRALAAFRRLAEAIGPERVVWRYDPILLSGATDHHFHLENFARIAKALDGATQGVVISILDPYAKAARRLDRLGEEQPEFRYRAYAAAGDEPLMRQLAQIAQAHSLRIQSCAETIDLTAAGIAPGKCIDDQLIRDVFGIAVSHTKDKGQRQACGCVESRDIGMYDSCLFGCAYCYATRSFKAAGAHHAARDPESASMIKAVSGSSASGVR
jgi:DNA repair photolyase